LWRYNGLEESIAEEDEVRDRFSIKKKKKKMMKNREESRENKS
jgi:hypothetical protein